MKSKKKTINKETSISESEKYDNEIKNLNKKRSENPKRKKYKIMIFFSTFTLIFSLFTVSYAGLFSGSDDLTTRITKGLTQIQGWILKIATPAAAVSIGFGLLMKKFSFGDEEKITTGKRLIRSTLFSYAFILLIDPIISAMQTLFS